MSGINLKKIFAPIDMTVGNPGKQIVAFAVPMLIGNIAQQLYNTADSVIVGRYVGDNALAAVGSAAPILNLLLVLFIAVAKATPATPISKLATNKISNTIFTTVATNK